MQRHKYGLTIKASLSRQLARLCDADHYSLGFPSMDNSRLKIGRAEKHLKELKTYLRSNRPFKYCLETNYISGERATFAKRNEEAANNAALIIGDVIHNLRAALDFIYWECTEKSSKSEGERAQIKFPITATEKSLNESVLPGLPARVSTKFSDALASLKPYREKGGNVKLCAIHDLDIMDKHKLLIPTGNFTEITADEVQKYVPDFPPISGGFGNCAKDVVWSIQPMTWTQRRKSKTPRSGIIVKELKLDVTTVLNIGEFEFPMSVDVTLAELVAETLRAIEVLYCTCQPQS